MIRSITALLFIVSASVVYAGDAAKGEKNFRKCASCHSIEEGGRDKIGPNLWNVMNRGTAQTEGYKYSKAFAAWAEDNPQWTPELMDQWLTKSKDLVKGTKMNFRERKETKREDLIAYLQSMGVPTE